MLRDRLLCGRGKVAIWGAGYIGFSCAALLARRGIGSLLVDIDKNKVKVINEGHAPYPEIETWIGFDTKPLFDLGLLRATTVWSEALEEVYEVHIIGVNTEKDGALWDEALRDVCHKIAKSKAKLVIVESTVSPNWTDEIVVPILGKDKLIAIAPRRDWFTLGQSCEVLDRVVGGVTPEATTEAIEILSVVSKKIHRTDYKLAELVKAVENAYRHLCIQLAFQLTLGYPNVDMREVLRLAGTKWNLDTYFPNIAIGGYCIPLAPDYLLEGAERGQEFSLLKEAKATEVNMARRVAESLIGKGFRYFGILGLAYRGNVKVHVLSPSIKLANILGKRCAVKINDPLYTKDEIKEISGFDSFDFPNGLDEFDCLIVACDHDTYRAFPKDVLFGHLKCKYILDCYGVWNHLKNALEGKGIEYHLTGDAGWL